LSARDNLLARIRAAQGKPAAVDAAELAVVHSHLAAHGLSPRPRVVGNPGAYFRARSLALASTVDEVDALHDVPQAVARFLKKNTLALTAICWPEFADLDWTAADMTVEGRAARDGDLTGITGAFCAIAETGTLMLVSGAHTPAGTSLLPETHIAIVRSDRIVTGMEDAWRLLRAEFPVMPRAVTFVSGPSRTADIEQTVTLGAHGPYRAHIVVIGKGWPDPAMS
jgi:L-lactate dehydrogenase complex protein LldG